MTITNRVLLFFLATLAFVLVGFSIAVYLLTRTYLSRQSEHSLEMALNTLVAAAEVMPNQVEWEPAERHLSFRSSFGSDIQWIVRDDDGIIVDRSDSSAGKDLLEDVAREDTRHRLRWNGERWHIGKRQVQPTNKGRGLSIVAGVPIEPNRLALSQLALVLATVSAAIWFLALVVGRTVCRKALAPLTELGEKICDATLEQRLDDADRKDELGDVARSFNDLLGRLQVSFEQQRRFTGDASHQLRTPLAAILGQIEVAIRRQRTPEEYRQVLTTVHEQSSRLVRIVEALLFLSRADAEAVSPRLQKIELNEWLVNLVKTWSNHPRFADIRLSAPHSCRFSTDPVLLGEMVGILLDNAAKFSQPGTPIDVTLESVESGFDLSIRDEGIGIPKTDLPLLFKPFFRSVNSRKNGIEGFGLGLSIAKRIAVALGGTLLVSSRLDVGSDFVFRCSTTELAAHSIRLEPMANDEVGENAAHRE